MSGEDRIDFLSEIEVVRGSNFADRLEGDDFGNQLVGSGGNDAIDGGEGNDILTGGGGADTFDFDARIATKTGGATDFGLRPGYGFRSRRGRPHRSA